MTTRISIMKTVPWYPMRTYTTPYNEVWHCVHTRQIVAGGGGNKHGVPWEPGTVTLCPVCAWLARREPYYLDNSQDIEWEVVEEGK